jgi:hypothetical protein
MGWWKVEGTQDIIGDAPLDTLTDAVAEVVSAYEEEFGRLPTRAEWQSLLSAVLGSFASDERVTDEGTVKSVTIELET